MITIGERVLTGFLKIKYVRDVSETDFGALKVY